MKSVINLIRTPLGYSILDLNNAQINKAASKPKDKPCSLPKKYTTQTFTIYPYIPTLQDNHKYVLVPARSQWFNLNIVHQIEKKALPEWFKIKKGILATMNNMKFQKHQELYKKYRNYIVELGRTGYITPTQARKGLAGDAGAIVRIHKFLEKWGLINYVHRKPVKNNKKKQMIQGNQEKLKQIQESTIRQKEIQKQKEKEVQRQKLAVRRDGFQRDKNLFTRSYGKDDLQLLKKITKKHRPICQFCQCLTGPVWYQYTQHFHLKSFTPSPNHSHNVINNIGQQFEYNLVICASCVHQGSIPMVLTIQDFTKKSLLDHVDDIYYDNQKKRNAQQNKIAEAIQRNRFNLTKTSQQLKMPQEYVFSSLMVMPIQKLQKIARIDPQTDVQSHHSQPQKEEKIPLKKQAKPETQSLQDKLTRQVKALQCEEREIYQKLMQSWLVKIGYKLERLSEWQEGVGAMFGSASRLMRNVLAERISTVGKSL